MAREKTAPVLRKLGLPAPFRSSRAGGSTAHQNQGLAGILRETQAMRQEEEEKLEEMLLELLQSCYHKIKRQGWSIEEALIDLDIYCASKDNPHARDIGRILLRLIEAGEKAGLSIDQMVERIRHMKK
jgi:hypothetical protein